MGPRHHLAVYMSCTRDRHDKREYLQHVYRYGLYSVLPGCVFDVDAVGCVSLYGFTWVFCIWDALLFLTNSVRASIPAFVLNSVASWWSGAPFVIIAWCSSYAWHLKTVLTCLEFFVA